MVYKNIVENKYTYHIRNNVCNGNLCSFFCVLIPVCVYCVVAAGIAVPVFVAVFSMMPFHVIEIHAYFSIMVVMRQFRHTSHNEAKHNHYICNEEL